MLAVLPHFVGTDFEFVALTPRTGPLPTSLQSLGVPCIPFEVRDSAGKHRPTEQILEQLDATVRRIGPDLVHGNSLAMGRLTGVVAAQSIGVYTAHLRDILRLSAAAVSHLNGNRALIAVSHAVRDFHVAQGLESGRVRVVYNGIDGRQTPCGPSTGWLKEELGLPKEAFLVAAIGQICLRKGQDIFANAASSMARHMPNAHFLLVGERYSEKAESVAFEESIGFEFGVAGLSARFHRLGFRTDIEKLLPEIDLIVHMARQEPFGRVLLEAAAAARPIAATTAGGTQEMLADEQSAILIPPDDPDRLAAAFLRLYNEPDLRRRLGDAARERVAIHFSIENAVRGLTDVWRHALDD